MRGAVLLALTIEVAVALTCSIGSPIVVILPVAVSMSQHVMAAPPMKSLGDAILAAVLQGCSLLRSLLRARARVPWDLIGLLARGG